jgi:hypothetical protein
MTLHPESGLPEATEPDEDETIRNWVEGFQTGRLDPATFVPRIYMLAYGCGFTHCRDEIKRQRKENENN